MILYLAGLKALDPALREAAAIDGASEARAFFKVVLPALKPINIVLVVITVIEALRAFDIVYIINSGRNGLELLSVLITDNIIGEASRIGYGSAIAVVLLDDLARPDHHLRLEQLPGGRGMTDDRRRGPARRGAEAEARRSTRSRVVLHVFLILADAALDRRRSSGRSSPRCGRTPTPRSHGYVSWPQHFNFDNFTTAWTQADSSRTTSGTRSSSRSRRSS